MNLLFIDTETGGLNPSKHSLLQVGAVAYVDGEIKEKLEFKIKHVIYNVNGIAMKINGLVLNEIDDFGLDTCDAVFKLNEFISRNFNHTLGLPILVGHNPSIDKYMIRYQLYERNNLDMDNFISHRMIDTMSIIWGLHFVGKLPIEACSSSGAFKYFDIQVEKLHDALDDCVATVQLFEKLLELLKK